MIEGVNVRDAKALLEDDDGALYVVHEKEKPVEVIKKEGNGFKKETIPFENLEKIKDELSVVRESTQGVD